MKSQNASLSFTHKLASWFSAGVNAHTPIDVARRIRLVNGLSTVLALLCLAGIPLDWPYLGERAVYHNALAAALFSLIPALNVTKRPQIAQLAFIIACLLSLLTFLIVFGSVGGIHYLCFPTLMLPVLLLNSRQRAWTMVLTALPILLFVLAEAGVMPVLVVQSAPRLNLVHWWNLAISFFLSCIGLQYMRAIHEADYRRIVDQQSQLTQAAKMSAVGRLAGGIAHEINNPLTIILAKTLQAKDLLTAGGDRERAVSHLDLVQSMVDRITRIIKGLNSISRGAERDLRLSVDAHDLVQQTLDLCRETLAKSGVRIETDFSHSIGDGPLLIQARAIEISQILTNLISNATDALATRATQSDKWIKIAVARVANQLAISVSDNGPGIPAVYREHIFEPFFTTKSVGEGIGLGLSISLSLTSANQGALALTSPSAPTTFTLRLPAV